MKKVLLIAFFAVFLIPIGVFANTDSLTVQPGEKFVFKPSVNYFGNGSGFHVEYYPSAQIKWRTFDLNTGQNVFPDSGWALWSGSSFFVYVRDDEYLEVWNDSDKSVTLQRLNLGQYVIYEKKTDPIQAVKDLPAVLVHQAGGILLVVLIAFATLLVVGLVPRLRSWFLRL